MARPIKYRLPQAGHAAVPKGKSGLGRKKPASPASPAVRPEPSRGKAIGGAEEHNGLLGAGKTGNGFAWAWNPARMGNPLHARYPAQRFWDLGWCRFQCVLHRPRRQTPVRGSMLEPMQTTRPRAHSTTQPMGGVVALCARRWSFANQARWNLLGHRLVLAGVLAVHAVGVLPC